MPPTRPLIVCCSWLVCVLAGCTVHSYSMHAQAHAGTATHGARPPRHEKREKPKPSARDEHARDEHARDEHAREEARGDTIDRGRDLTAAGPRLDTASHSPAHEDPQPTTPEATEASSTDREQANAAAAEAEAKEARDAERARKADERKKRAQIKKVRDAQVASEAAHAAHKGAGSLELVEGNRRVQLTKQERLTAAVKRDHAEEAERKRVEQAKLSAVVKRSRDAADQRVAQPDAGERMRLLMAR